MKEKFAKDLKPGEKVTEFFALRKSELLEKDGKFRLKIELGDTSGRIDAVWWDVSKEDADQFQIGSIVKVRGVVSSFQDKPQVRVERMRPAAEAEYDLGDFLPRSQKSEEELSRLLDTMIDRVQNSYLKKLLTAIFGQADLRKKYLSAPAGKLLHHDIVGGLAEHSLSMAEVAVRLADHYPKLDRDLLICGTLLHDIGKIWEFKVTAVIDYSDAGRLIGHINQGDEFITSAAKTIDNFPTDLLMHLRHLIISHQGARENGSPVVPMTPEALFLYHVDELDSKMGAIEKIRERTGGVGWSEWKPIFDRYFFFGRNEKNE